MTNSYKGWLNLDVENIEPIELSSSQKANLKHNILKNTAKKKPNTWVRQVTAAAIIGIITILTISFTVPTFASQIPFMQNIIGYFNNEDTMLERFDEFATDIRQVQTSNGISLMIEEAVYDGTSISVSYALETNTDLGFNPHIANQIDVIGSKSMVAHGSLKKINDMTYVGIAKIVPHFNSAAPDEIEITWEPKALLDRNANIEVKGDWAFRFKLLKLEGDLELVNEMVSKHDVTVRFTSIEQNDMSTIIRYESFVESNVLKEWSDFTVQFDKIQDNLGHTYIVDGNGAQSKDYGRSYSSSASVQSINKAATSITIVPVIYFSLGSGKGVETKEMDPITISLN